MTADLTALREELASALADAGVQEQAEAIAALARPCVTLSTTSTGAGFIPLGASRIGGDADLPADLEWPACQGVPLRFLAQLDLREVANVAPPGLLPDSGLLSFFYLGDLETLTLEEPDPDAWRVIWIPPGAAPLVRRGAPVAGSRVKVPPGAWSSPAFVEPSNEPFAPCTVALGAALSLPDEDTAERELGVDPYDYDVLDAMDALRHRGHQLLGFASPVQDDPAGECPRTNGQASNDGEGEDADEDEAERPRDWRLLFQLDSDDDAGMMWGDSGMLYFMIREPDLRERRFDRVWTVFQCA